MSMLEWMSWLQQQLLETLVGEFIVTITSVVIAHGVMAGIRRWQYGGWSVEITKGGETLLDRPISVTKARQIRGDKADESVYLKGVVSPYAWLNRDLLSPQSLEDGLLVIDERNKRYHIDLDKNPVLPRRDTCRYPRSEETEEQVV